MVKESGGGIKKMKKSGYKEERDGWKSGGKEKGYGGKG